MEEVIIREKDLIQVSGNPIDLAAIQGVKVNGESKITATEKVKLDRLLTETLKVKAEVLETMKREVKKNARSIVGGNMGAVIAQETVLTRPKRQKPPSAGPALRG